MADLFPTKNLFELLAGDDNVSPAFRNILHQMNLPGDCGMQAWRDYGATGSPVSLPAGPYDNA